VKLVDKTVRDFCRVLASEEAAPGGSAAAALQGVLGASLIGMTASLTVGRKRYTEYGALMKDIIKRSGDLQQNMLDIIDHDKEAFMRVSKIYSMPKNNEEETAIRNDAMQTALKTCTLIPFELMQCVYNTLELAMVMVGKYNTNAISDLGVAVLCLKSAAESAWLNVLTNLDGIRDEIFTAKYMIAGGELIQRVEDLADDIHEDILHGLYPEPTR